jgi:hypothetical protein
MRTIQTVQRIGQEFPESVLEFNPETRTLSLGTKKSEADVQGVEVAILECLEAFEGTKTEPEIGEAVEGKTTLKRKALRQLVEAGKITRDGRGTRGDPFRYRFAFSCSQHKAGTREQESGNGTEPRMNTGDILVPNSSRDSILVSTSQVQERRFDEGEL